MLIIGFLHRLVRAGRLRIIDASGVVRTFGPGGGPTVTVRLHSHRLPYRLLLSPFLVAGEAYMAGTLTLEEGTLREFLDLCTRNMAALERHPLQRVLQPMRRPLRRRLRHNPKRRARANVAHHYELSTALYDLFLDRDRQYSCAYFMNGNESLEEAQANKKRHIAAKLLLEPGMKVLDIGSGWGGLAVDLARLEDVEVTGITLSRQQLDAAREHAKAARLTDKVSFALHDYREERGSYDRIVSVGMLEHVGTGDYDAFFRTLQRILRPNGVALVHAIGRMTPPGEADPWLQKYVFPGGYCPAVSEVLAAIERTGLWVTDVEILRLHYAETLRHWSERFREGRDRARAIYGERFCRMWEFYLALCEMAFRNGPMMVFQIQLARRRDAVPLTRDYIAEAERRRILAMPELAA